LSLSFPEEVLKVPPSFSKRPMLSRDHPVSLLQCMARLFFLIIELGSPPPLLSFFQMTYLFLFFAPFHGLGSQPYYLMSLIYCNFSFLDVRSLPLEFFRSQPSPSSFCLMSSPDSLSMLILPPNFSAAMMHFFPSVLPFFTCLTVFFCAFHPRCMPPSFSFSCPPSAYQRLPLSNNCSPKFYPVRLKTARFSPSKFL